MGLGHRGRSWIGPRGYPAEGLVIAGRNTKSNSRSGNGSGVSSGADAKKPRRGLQGAIEGLLQKFVEYLDALLLYAQRHTEEFFHKLIWKGIWFILVFFTICIGFGYLSFALYLGFDSWVGGKPILSSALTGASFLSVSFLFLRFLLAR